MQQMEVHIAVAAHSGFGTRAARRKRSPVERQTSRASPLTCSTWPP